MANLSECYCENGLGITEAYLLGHPEASSLTALALQALAQQENESHYRQLYLQDERNLGAPKYGLIVCNIVDPRRYTSLNATFQPQVLLLGQDTIPEGAFHYELVSVDPIPLMSDLHRLRAGALLKIAGSMITGEQHEILCMIQRTGSLFPLLSEELIGNILKFHPLCGPCPLHLNGKCIPRITNMTDLGMIMSMASGSMDIERHLIL